MSSSATSTFAAPAAGTARPAKAILVGGLLVGVLDISSAIGAWAPRGVTPERVFQSVASGALGPAAFQGGWTTAFMGLGFHFLIAFTATAVYYVASRFMPLLTRHWILMGMFYGDVVCAFMQLVVIPLSHARPAPFGWQFFVTGPVGHLFLVGLPIGWATKKWG